MKEQFQSFTQLCTRSLADDPALRLEVGQELENHLEDACAEERSEGKTDAEAEELAKQRFGEPEELAQSLLDANRRRLKLRARLRLAVKIALIPAVLIGLALCIDLRTLAGFTLLDELHVGAHSSPLSKNFPGKLFNRVIEHDLNHLSEKDRDLVQSFLQSWFPGQKTTWEKACFEADPENPMFTAHYALSLIPADMNRWGEKERTEYLRVLGRGRRIDPDNALYDYLEADLALRTALVAGKKDGEYEITDRAALDRSMKLYLAGLRKPFVRIYAMDLPTEVSRLLNPDNDYLGMLERISIYASAPLSFLNRERWLTKTSLFYAETLQREGKTAEAEPYFRAWRQFIPQMQKFDSKTLIEVLVHYNCIKIHQESAEKRGDKAEAETLAKIYAPMKHWKEQKDPNVELLQKHAGVLSAILLPALREEIPLKELGPERRLSYLVLDLAGLAALSLLLAACILILTAAVLAARLAGNRPFLLLLPGKAYLRVLLWGIAVPIAAFLLYTHIDALGGRDLSLSANLQRLTAGLIGIVLVFPLVFKLVYRHELKKQGKALGFPKGRLPFATACLNMLCGFAALLLVTGCVLRPLLAWECRRNIEKNELFDTDRGFTRIEVETTNRFNAILADAIAAADQKR